MSSSAEENGGWVPADQVQQMIEDALARHQQTTGPVQGSASADQVQQMIEQALARQAEQYQTQLDAMAQSMRGQVVTFIPHNGGGKGTDIAETWSMYEQSLAHAADAEKVAAALAAPRTDQRAPAFAAESMFPSVHG